MRPAESEQRSKVAEGSVHTLRSPSLSDKHTRSSPSSRAATIAPTGEDVQRRQAIAITGVWIGAMLQEHAHRLKIASPIASR
jgi:hypothetical protein